MKKLFVLFAVCFLVSCIGTSVPNWNSTTIYNAGDSCMADSIPFVSTANDNVNNWPPASPVLWNHWY